jgi:hypothetical protein
VSDAKEKRFVDKSADFPSFCEKHRITMMPIRRDSCFGDALANHENVADWAAKPGTERVAVSEGGRHRA